MTNDGGSSWLSLLSCCCSLLLSSSSLLFSSTAVAVCVFCGSASMLLIALRRIGSTKVPQDIDNKKEYILMLKISGLAEYYTLPCSLIKHTHNVVLLRVVKLKWCSAIAWKIDHTWWYSGTFRTGLPELRKPLNKGQRVGSTSISDEGKLQYYKQKNWWFDEGLKLNLSEMSKCNTGISLTTYNTVSSSTYNK